MRYLRNSLRKKRHPNLWDTAPHQDGGSHCGLHAGRQRENGGWSCPQNVNPHRQPHGLKDRGEMVSPLFFPPTSHHVTCPVCAQFVGRKVWCKNTPFPLKPPYRFFEGNVPYLFPAVMIFYFKKTKPSQTNSQIHKDTLVVVDTLKLCGCLSRAIGNA